MGLVYSTDNGRLCSECSQPVDVCQCRKKTVPAGDGVVRVSRETKGRKGKGVTLIQGIPLEEKALKAYVKKLKQKCSTGGAIKDGVVEIQGDHRELLMAELAKEGWTVKRSGG